VLVGINSMDDAAVYRISDEAAVVVTVDFFTPLLDDPYMFGQVAAANALSDIYAMGARPLFALNIVGFPTREMPLEILTDILRGASDKAREAGIGIIGGHSIDDPEPKYGLVVAGIVHPEKILRNSTAREGDILILTKPLGTGILATALKRGLLKPDEEKSLAGAMAFLNRDAAEAMQGLDLSACTDVTGFGLLGHLYEMASGSGLSAEIDFPKVNFLSCAPELAEKGVVPGGTRRNLAFYSKYCEFAPAITETQKLLLADAQTSGGLLISIAPHHVDLYLERVKTKLPSGHAAIIGKIIVPREPAIRILP